MKKRSVIVSYFCLCSFAFAHETAVVSPIIVKGSKEAKTYVESTESITILDDEYLSGAGRENSTEVLNALPNIEVNKNGDTFSIRGINNTGVTGYQKDNVASLIIDDIFQTDLALQAGSFDLWDAQSIEIFRGAQSTTQGVNSLAGSILLYHNVPSFSNTGMAKLGLESFGGKKFGVATNNELIQGKLSSRISYNKEMSNGYITNTFNDNDQWGGTNKDVVNFNLMNEASDKDHFRLNFKYNRTNNGGTYIQSFDPSQYTVNNDVDYHTKTNNFQTALHYERNLGENLTNNFIMAFSTSNQDNTSDADGLPQNEAGTRNEHHQDDFVSVENLVNYKTDRVKNVFGLYSQYFYLMDNYHFNLLYGVGTSSTPVAIAQSVQRFRNMYSLFDSALYKLDSVQSVELGVRLEYVLNRYGTNVDGQRTQDLGASTNAKVDTYLNQVRGAYEGNNSNFIFLPKIGYLIDLDRHHLGLTYTRGYRTGGVSINRSQAKAVNYDPEFTDNYELSYKYPSNDFNLSTNFFYVNWKDQQVLVQLSANDFFNTQVQNASSSEVYGGEFQGEYFLTPAHSFTYGLGYAKTKFTDFTNNGVSYAGNQFPFAAEWTHRITYRGRFFDNFSFLAICRYLSTAFSNVDNSRTVPAQFYMDFNLSYVWKSLLSEFYVKNTLDNKYLIYDGRPSSSTSTYQASYNQTNMPREFGMRVTYFW